MIFLKIFQHSAEKDSNRIHIYDAQSPGIVLHILDKLHLAQVQVMCYNIRMATVISVDAHGIVEYWQNSNNDYKFPQQKVLFESKLDTGT